MRICVSVLIAVVVSFTGIDSVFGQSEVGQKVLDFAMDKEGKKVKRGECWDLVAEALDYAGADWTPPGKFGDKIDWESQKVHPGDIMEFRSVKIKSPDNYELQMPQHFAVIKEQTGTRSYRILHQNYNGQKRVSELDIDLNHMVRGKVTVYRPSD